MNCKLLDELNEREEMQTTTDMQDRFLDGKSDGAFGLLPESPHDATYMAGWVAGYREYSDAKRRLVDCSSLQAHFSHSHEWGDCDWAGEF